MRFSIPIRRTRALLAPALAGCFLLAGSAAAETPKAKPDATPTAHDAEFARFVEKSLAEEKKAAPPAAPAPQTGATCDASNERARQFATLKQMEAELERLRARQAAKWAETGRNARQAAEAGEPVVLNGSGFNIKNGAPGR